MVVVECREWIAIVTRHGLGARQKYSGNLFLRVHKLMQTAVSKLVL
jgi:hypothetical protein